MEEWAHSGVGGLKYGLVCDGSVLRTGSMLLRSRSVLVCDLVRGFIRLLWVRFPLAADSLHN